MFGSLVHLSIWSCQLGLFFSASLLSSSFQTPGVFAAGATGTPHNNLFPLLNINDRGGERKTPALPLLARFAFLRELFSSDLVLLHDDGRKTVKKPIGDQQKTKKSEKKGKRGTKPNALLEVQPVHLCHARLRALESRFLFSILNVTAIPHE